MMDKKEQEIKKWQTEVVNIIEPPEFEKNWKNLAYLDAAGAIDSMTEDNWKSALEQLESAVQQISMKISKG